MNSAGRSVALINWHADEVSGKSDLHSFVIRIWLEEVDVKTRQPIWHGHITRLPEGKRHYFKSLKEIPEFIQAHLEAEGE